MRFLLRILFVIFACNSVVLAQEVRPDLRQGAKQQESTQQVAQAKPLDGLRIELDRVEAASERDGLSSATLSGLRQELEQVSDRLHKLTSEIEPNVKSAEDRLKQFGAKPDAAKGESEAPEIASERDVLSQTFAQANAELKQARLLLVRSEQLSDHLLSLRRDLFAKQLFQRSFSLLDPALWIGAVEGLPRFVLGVHLLISDWLSVLFARPIAAFIALSGAVVLIAAYQIAHRRLLALLSAGLRPSRANQPLADEVQTLLDPQEVSFIHRLPSLYAALSTLLRVVLIVAAAWGVIGLFDLLSLMPARVETVARGVVIGLGSFTALRALSMGILSPFMAQYRLIPVCDAVALRIHTMLVWAGGVTAITTILNRLNTTIVSPLTLTVALSAISALLFAGTLMAGLVAISDKLEEEQDTASPCDPALLPSQIRWGRLALWIVSLSMLAGLIIGYAAFSAFLARQTVWFLIVFGLLFIILRLVDEVFAQITSTSTPSAKRLARVSGMQLSSIAQIGILSSGILRLLLMVIATFMVVAPWGIESRDAFGWARAAFFGLQVGGITISLASLLGAVVLFILSLIVTRSIQRWLDEKLLPATRMDAGLRNSIRTAFGYVGTIIAAGIAFSYMGLDVQNFAIVAGALSVGIGFGLQSIVNNFVSGLILLAERPVKAGDWIVVGDQEGYVKRINVRSTEIETFDRAVVILPNSNLVSGTVKNWMHNDQLGRIRLKILVAADCIRKEKDAEHVRDLLVSIAQAHASVMKDPAPRVFLLDMKKEEMEFELSCTVSNVDKAYGVRSDLRFAIFNRFLQESIRFA